CIAFPNPPRAILFLSTSPGCYWQYLLRSSQSLPSGSLERPAQVASQTPQAVALDPVQSARFRPPHKASRSARSSCESPPLFEAFASEEGLRPPASLCL